MDESVLFELFPKVEGREKKYLDKETSSFLGNSAI